MRASAEAPGAPRGRPSAPRASPSAPLRSTSPLEHHDSSLLRPHHDLDQVERELVHHCASLLPGDDKAEACWEAWRFLEAKRDAAESECGVGEAGAGGDCSKLERLDAFMHDLNGTGEVSSLVSALGTLARTEARAAARAAEAPTEPASAAAEEHHVPGSELPPGRKVGVPGAKSPRPQQPAAK